MITYIHENYRNRLKTRYTVEYINNQKDMDYVQSGKISLGDPCDRYKKRTYDCIEDAIRFYMVSLFNTSILDIKFSEEILLDNDVVRESYIEPYGTFENTIIKLINEGLYKALQRAHESTEALEKRLYLVNKWFLECKLTEETFNKFVSKTLQENNKLTVYRYYSLLRPIGPGTYPKPSEVKNIVNFDDKTFVYDINRYAWGYVEYEKELSWDEARDYDLEWNKHTKMVI